MYFTGALVIMPTKQVLKYNIPNLSLKQIKRHFNPVKNYGMSIKEKIREYFD